MSLTIMTEQPPGLSRSLQGGFFNALDCWHFKIRWLRRAIPLVHIPKTNPLVHRQEILASGFAGSQRSRQDRTRTKRSPTTTKTILSAHSRRI